MLPESRQDLRAAAQPNRARFVVQREKQTNGQRRIGMYKRILVPLDGSKLAECVLPHVEALAKGCQTAEVEFVQIGRAHV